MPDLTVFKYVQVLHLRENLIHKTKSFTSDLENVRYLNLRQNDITKLRYLRYLQRLPRLETLIVLENPLMGKFFRFIVDNFLFASLGPNQRHWPNNRGSPEVGFATMEIFA